MGGRTCEGRGRDAALSQGGPRIASPHRKLGRGKEGFYLESQREWGPEGTLILDPEPPELRDDQFLWF